MCGTKRRTSIRKESNAVTTVRMLKMNNANRYRGECDGAGKCAEAASMNIIKVKSAATG